MTPRPFGVCRHRRPTNSQATHNIIHIVLDTFPTYTFVDILEADRSTFDRDWSGFTFFPDHLGAYVYTKGSMPAMLAGVAFRNEMPFAEFLDHHPSIFHALGQQGYRLRSLTSFGNDHPSRSFPGADATIRYDIPNPYGSYRDYVDVTVARLLDLSLFRSAPHALKPGIYRNQQWLFQQRIALRRGPEAADHRAFGDAMFLRDFASQVTAGDDKPVYTLLHVLAPHLAVATDADCNSRLSMHPVQEEVYGPGAVRLVKCPRTIRSTSSPRPLRPKRHHCHLGPWMEPVHARRSTSNGRNANTGQGHPRRGRSFRHASAPGQTVRSPGSAANLVRAHCHHRHPLHCARHRGPPGHPGTRHVCIPDRSRSAPAAHVRTPYQ